MAPLRRHRTRPRVIRPEQAHAEGLRFIHLGFPWRRGYAVGRRRSDDRGRALPASPSPGPLVVGIGSL
jgi:hypothetical protein